MILALINDINRFQFLIDQLEEKQFKIRVFESVANLQRHLEHTPSFSGLIVDFTQQDYQDFLIRFALRYPQTPVLSLKKQSSEQLNLRLLAFIRRLISEKKVVNHGKILLVDDSRTVQLQYVKVLQSAGYEVETADNAEQGFNKALANEYDLAIIDYFMPGDNGAQLCRNLQENESTYELTTAILTAQYKQEVVDECLTSGAHDCMFKNESFDLFLTRVSALIRSVERKSQIDKERNRLIGLLYAVAEGVFGVTADGRIQFVNPAALKLLGQSSIDLIGHFPHDCIHPIDNGGKATSFDHCFLQQAYLLGDELRDWRTLFQRADGSLFPVECSVMMLGDVENNDGSVVVFRDISEQQRLETNWQWQLNHDQLTGLLNRTAFENLMNRELIRIKRSKEIAMLFFIDLDKFKIINDELGHAAGDQLLINLAENLKLNARSYDHIGRLSGDEFVVMLTQIKAEEVEELAERYRILLENTELNWKGKNYLITGSIGICLLDEFSESIGEILVNADTACHQAKLKGRNQWAIFHQHDDQKMQQGNWFQRLTNAMQDQQFILLEQPIFDIKDTDKKVGVNCLLRLQEGTALISPALFMSNAKRFAVIKTIDRFVFESLLSYCKTNRHQLLSWYSLSLSIEAMADNDFINDLLSDWLNGGMHPAQLRFEIGEEELFNFPQWKKHLSDIRAKGFGIIISHFGMNSQSILNLPQLPIDAIKLDTNLTRALSTSLPRCFLVDAIVKTAKQANIHVIATHVESVVDIELFSARGIEQVQGFYLQKPAILA